MNSMVSSPLFPTSFAFCSMNVRIAGSARCQQLPRWFDGDRRLWSPRNDVFCGQCPLPVTTVLLIAVGQYDRNQATFFCP